MRPGADGTGWDALQEIRVESGYAYGTIGADIHVFGNGTPVYRLFEHQPVTALDTEWLRAQPSRMLDSRSAVVDFAGRDEELRALVAWRDTGQRLAVRWLHGEGGQGKTRLALQLASDASARGWKVVDAVHGTDTHPPAELKQDLRLDGHAGVLVLVDYADRWPVSHLSWLFHNRLLQKDVPARILLLARSVDQWPAVRGRLNRLRVNADPSDQYLAPIPEAGEQREHLFSAARDSFARHYRQITRPERISPPDTLNDTEFGLTLAVLMAALVAVDAAAHDRRAPAGMTGLTAYLLDREHENWEQLYETSGAGSGYRTPPAVMARMVFLASLIGLSHRSYAEPLIGVVSDEIPPEVLLADHSVCYPSTELFPEGVLQPLLPDRLAEDFLALTLPGSPVTAYPTDRLSGAVCRTFLEPLSDALPRNWIMRAVTFLAAAAARWPHVGAGYLYPMLRAHPEVAAHAGSTALLQLASVEDVDLDMLTMVDDTIEDLSGELARFDLATGAVATCDRVTPRRLEATSAPDERMRLLNRLGLRMLHAGRPSDAIRPLEDAVDLGRRSMAEADPSVLPLQIKALIRLSRALMDTGQLRFEAFALSAEAAQVSRALVDAGSDSQLLILAECLSTASDNADALGRGETALEFIDEAVSIYQFLRETSHDSVLPQLASALNALGRRLRSLGRIQESARPTFDAMEIRGELAKSDFPTHFADNVRSMIDFGICTAEMGLSDQALNSFNMATGFLRKLIEVRPGLLPDLADGLEWTGRQLAEAGRTDEALVVTEEAVAIRRKEWDTDSTNAEALANSLHMLALRLDECGRTDEAADAAGHAFSIRWALANVVPEMYSFGAIALDLGLRGRLLRRLGRLDEAETELMNARAALRDLPDQQLTPRLPERLAGILDELAGVLHELGKPHEARDIAAEAATMRRRTPPPPSQRRRRVYSPSREFQRPDEAETGELATRLTLKTAILVHRPLAEKEPDRYLPALAVALHNLGRHQLRNDERPDDAITSLRESCGVFRELSQNNIFHVPQLALILNNLGSALYQIDRHEEALAPSLECVELYRRLEKGNPSEFRPDLGAALSNLGRRLEKLSRRGEALAAFEEALEVFRRLAADDPDRHLSPLADTLTRVSDLLSAAGRLEDAISPQEEAVGILRQLARDEPTHVPGLAAGLNNLGVRFSEALRPADAIAPTQESLEIHRRLVQENPREYMPLLAASLLNMGIRQSAVDRPDAAVEMLGEAVGRYRQLVVVDGPAAHGSQLAVSLGTLGRQLAALGRYEEMLAVSQEGLDLLRPFAESDPETHLPEFTRWQLLYAEMRLHARLDLVPLEKSSPQVSWMRSARWDHVLRDRVLAVQG
ncbi:tetratricopeptide repeat protein, partial [Streptomyces malaysiensis]|uniref:tetratricopeptide repeat protein n=1 Tax=Streptomyces malaysiensis TaxID=92644 RepID=UPI00372475CF